LVAGPIERAKNIIPQLENGLKTKIINIKPALFLITTGYFKKVMIGDNCAKFADHIFGNIEYYNSPELLFAILLFSLQIYADFSGYSNIARGISLLFGIKLMVNFNQPYLSKSIKEFWQRWHISLSTWLRDYLYKSLGGNRVKKWKVYRNLLITMLLGGLWHGAGWNFIIWGFLHGIYLTIHKIILLDKSIIFKINSFFNKPITIIKIITTNILVLITWLFFRVNNINDITLFFQKLIHWQPSEFTPRIIVILLTYFSATLLLDSLEYNSNSHLYILSIKRTAIQWGIMCGILFICLVFMFQTKPNPFIYFQF
jgi:D-alanyl-lipoteichoic acid acyltransferase DltB (MBOAT superfamily)